MGFYTQVFNCMLCLIDTDPEAFIPTKKMLELQHQLPKRKVGTGSLSVSCLGSSVPVQKQIKRVEENGKELNTHPLSASASAYQ